MIRKWLKGWLLKEKAKLWAILLTCISIISIYFWNLQKYVVDQPYMRDDSLFFLKNLQDNYLTSSSISERLEFLLVGGTKPYPKILGRIVQLLDFHVTGNISFAFLQYSGGFLLIGGLCFLYGFIKKEHKWLIIVLTALLAFHLETNTWGVALYGYHAHIFFILGTFYFLHKSKYWLSGIFMFCTFFSSRDDTYIGIIILLFFAIRFLLTGKRLTILLGAILHLFVFLISRHLKETITFFERRKTKSNVDIDGFTGVKNVLTRFLDNFGDYLSLPFQGGILSNLLRNHIFLYGTLSLFIIVIAYLNYRRMSIKNIKLWIHTHLALLAMFFYFLMIATGTLMWRDLNMRYAIYALYLISIIIVLVADSVNLRLLDGWKYLIPIIIFSLTSNIIANKPEIQRLERMVKMKERNYTNEICNYDMMDERIKTRIISKNKNRFESVEDKWFKKEFARLKRRAEVYDYMVGANKAGIYNYSFDLSDCE